MTLITSKNINNKLNSKLELNTSYRNLLKKQKSLNNELDSFVEENKKFDLKFDKAYKPAFEYKFVNSNYLVKKYIKITLSILTSVLLLDIWGKWQNVNIWDFSDISSFTAISLYSFFILIWIAFISIFTYIPFAFFFDKLEKYSLRNKRMKKNQLENKRANERPHSDEKIKIIKSQIYECNLKINKIYRREREKITNRIEKNKLKTTNKKPNAYNPERKINESSIKIIEDLYEDEFEKIENGDNLNKNDKVLQTIRIYSSVCSIVAIQPLPFADIFVLTPIQVVMGKKIASIRGYNVSDSKSQEIIKEIIATLGMGILAQQLTIGFYKLLIPFLGALTTIPMVFGLTYGIGKTMDFYIQGKISGNTLNKNEMKSIFKSARKQGKEEGKKRASEIKVKSSHI